MLATLNNETESITLTRTDLDEYVSHVGQIRDVV